MPPIDAIAVKMQGITKQFHGVIANQQIDFEVKAGEIHALLGENGAGKTTLMNILCGLYEPDAGSIWLHGQPVRLKSPKAAISAGIGMVHQHFRLVERFTVAENILLGEENRPFLRESPRQLRDRLQQFANQYGLKINPTAPIWQLSVGEQQRVEILKALTRNANVLILDEPTAVLTPQESEALMDTLRTLASQGIAIIFISHKLKEVMALCHRITVLRDGQTMATVNTQDTTEPDLARMMVGREVELRRRGRGNEGEEDGRDTQNSKFGSADSPEAKIPFGSTQGEQNSPTSQSSISKPQSLISNPPALQLKNLWVMGDHGLPALRGINLTLNAGEIVGIAGVDGNGQRELEEAIAGLRSLHQGEIWRGGNLAHIPSDRYSMGMLTEFSVAENLVLKDINQVPFSRRGVIRPRVIINHAVDLVQRYLIRTASVRMQAGKLSGGNAQKMVFARELTREHQVLLAAQPTRGLDISATEFVHAQLMTRRDAGIAVLLISTDLDEILNLSDRIAVLYEGQISGWLDSAELDIHHLGLLMAGKPV
ncbi:MAG: ABC transporter ATP-binding protein [Oscillatoriales cyanobacterium C42_A2020_001]|nr:ABC transporter ATP-binding protein [Leptolyngbyaceae cyanobacterium C42_A2020_001]